jgi:hypothetical protein
VGFWLGTTFETIDHWIAPGVIALVVVALAGYLWRVSTWKPRAKP